MDMQFFPAELRALPQWCVASLLPDASGKEDKRPYNPKTGNPASATDPRTWGTFEQALQMRDYWRQSSAPRAQIGFVFNENDPFAVIDLDTYKAKIEGVKQFHADILGACDGFTYCERSQSGLGTHIIGIGSVLDGARNETNCIELYSHARFMICTGDVPCTISAVADIQELLDRLYVLIKDGGKTDVANWRELGNGEASLLTDLEILERASNAQNADKFLALCQGDLSMHDGDWSRADEALIQFFCFYTLDNNQVARLFKRSNLAKRDKAERPDYIPRTISYARAKLLKDAPPPLDMSAIAARAAQVAKPQIFEHETMSPVDQPLRELPRAVSKIVFPPGIIGDIARYVLASATRPVPEIALATAIAAVAGIVGRQYNCSSPPTGLNQYILLLAKTGTGKESVQSSIDRLFAEVTKTVAAADTFLGPARFASGQALVKQFQTQPCFVSILGEFGDTIKQISSQRANGAERALLQNLKDIYHKSGHNQMLRATVHSDKEKNTSNVQSPTLTILGETAPEPFFAGLDETMIDGGFLPRFLVIEYLGDRPDRNIGAISAPPADLVQRVADLIAGVLQMQQNRTNVMVHPDAEAGKLLDGFDRWVDGQMRGGNETTRQLWNRAHIKVLRLSALVAVGENALSPVVTADNAAWAIEMVKNDVSVLLDRFTRGDVGEGDAKLQADLKAVVAKYLAEGGKGFEEFHKRGCIPMRFLAQRTANRSAFKNNRFGATKALKDTLDAMVAYGVFMQIDKKSSQEWFKTGSLVYALGDQWDRGQ